MQYLIGETSLFQNKFNYASVTMYVVMCRNSKFNFSISYYYESRLLNYPFVLFYLFLKIF